MKDNVIVEIRIVPLGTASPSMHEYIAAVVKEVKQSNLQYQLTSMSTVIQGPLSRVMELAMKMHEIPFNMGVKRISTIIAIDDRRDKLQSMEEKMSAVI